MHRYTKALDITTYLIPTIVLFLFIYLQLEKESLIFWSSCTNKYVSAGKSPSGLPVCIHAFIHELIKSAQLSSSFLALIYGLLKLQSSHHVIAAKGKPTMVWLTD